MLGRVRRSSTSSLELELEERLPCSKIIKDNSLSIYETTLMKLKQGSLRDQSSMPQDSLKTDQSGGSSSPSEELTMLHEDCPSTDPSSNPSARQSMSTSSEQRYRNLSVIYMFSRYQNSQHALRSLSKNAMAMEDDCSSTSLSTSNDYLISSTRQ